jgi:hypothetical protein
MRLLFLFVLTVAVLNDRLLIGLFLRAMGISDATAKEIFSELGLSQTQWSRQIHGVEPPRFLGRLGRLQSEKGLETFRWYLFLTCAAVGLPEEAKRAERIHRTVQGHKRMARMARMHARERQAS